MATASRDPSPAVGFVTRRAASLAPAVPPWLHLVLVWHERARQRRQLADLGDGMLKDLGLTRADVEREAGKPFWRP